jgi:hypothetical protein
MKSQSPDYFDLYPHGKHQGAISYRGQNFRYIYCEKGYNQWLFVFDPQTEGMTLTNAADFVLEQIFSHLIMAKIINLTGLKDLATVGSVVLRDSNGDYAQVNIKPTTATNIHGETVVTGVAVRGWKHFDFSKEFFELFKLLE